MNDVEKFLFDLNGFLVVEDILTGDRVRAMNDAIDANRGSSPDRSEPGLSQGAEALVGKYGRGHFGGCLDWPEPWCQPFRDLMVQPAVLRYMISLIGVDLRWEGLAGLTNVKDSEGHLLHGGGFSHAPDLEQGFFHRVEFGKIRNGLVAIMFLLSDVNPGDGGFSCIPGSHKTNFECPWPIRRLEMGAENVRQLAGRAGSAILFTEALIHGALPWRAGHERRVLIYRYGPGNMAFGAPEVPDGTLSSLSPLHEALLKPPSFPERSDFSNLLGEAGA